MSVTKDEAYISKLFKLFNEMPKYKTQGQEDCADCEWLAEETDGQTLICNECALEQNIAEFKANNPNSK